MSEPTASECLKIIRGASYYVTSTQYRYAEKGLERVGAAVAALEAIRDRHTCFFVAVCEQDPCSPEGTGGTPCQDCLTTWDAVRALDALTPNTPTKEQASSWPGPSMTSMTRDQWEEAEGAS